MKRIGSGLALGFLVALLVGCGSGGSSDDGVDVCSAGTFAPSYVSKVEVLRWRTLPVSISFANDPTLQGRSLRTVALAGMEAWRTATGGVLAYNVIEESAATVLAGESVANITVTFNVLPARPTSGGELGHTTLKFTGHRLKQAEIRIDVWQNITAEEIDKELLASTTHEFGHALGINGHSDEKRDVMSFEEDASQQAGLTERDINTMKTAYCTEFGVSRAACVPDTSRAVGTVTLR